MRAYAAPRDLPPPPAVKPIAWTVPAGWKELPSQGPSQFGRYATIQVAENDPAQVLTVNQVSSGDMLSNLNRWEGQLGLTPSSAEEAQKKAKVVQVEAHDAARIDLTGVATDPKTNASSPQRMLAVIVPEGSGAWSFLLRGTPENVAAQEAKFDEFVKSVHFPTHNHGHSHDDGHDHAHDGDGHNHGDASAASQPTAPPPPADSKPYALSGFATPPGWEQDPTPRTMRTATFFAGVGNDRAEVMVTKLPANRFGSMLMNVNRWRTEVGLPATDDEHKEDVQQSTIAGANALVFDFAGPDKRSNVAMIVKGADVWFFKIIGPAKTVGDQRANFDAFLKSLQFSEAGGN